ncbi:MAG TPA: TSUP family transporter [Woeseiaceae bacterium]|nr:TSUP family transporter [Woeseiaceae bacterium]
MIESLPITVLLGAAIVGLTLGLLGSGGSILCVPVLVYLAGLPEKTAIVSSLAIVGAVALVGAFDNARHGTVSVRHLLWFGVPGMAGTWLGAQASAWVSGSAQLLVFALVMMLAAIFMLRSSRGSENAGRAAPGRLVVSGIVVGAMTGFVGVGGGFLIVPALVFFGGMAMQGAVGTSLAIIALNAAVGFAGHYLLFEEGGLELDWTLIGVFIAVGVVGSLLGGRLGRRLPQRILRRVFAVALILIALFIGVETILETHADADHLTAAAYLKTKMGAPVAIGRGIVMRLPLNQPGVVQ